jgi:hypothetical protein
MCTPAAAMATDVRSQDGSTIVGLGAYRVAAPPRNAVRPARARFDQVLAAEFRENFERAIAQQIPVAREAIDARNPRAGGAFVDDSATLSERVQDALLASGDVHVGDPSNSYSDEIPDNGPRPPFQVSAA